MSLITKTSRNIDLRIWEGEFPVRYRYTCGIAAERFFREIKDHGTMKGLRCHECNVVHVPPSIYCDKCFSRLDEWVDVGTRGSLHSFTVSYLNRDGSRREEPTLLGIINIDRTEGALIHRLGEVEPLKLEIGMPMEAVFKKTEEREGSILDILYFRPIQ
ncbi:MAG: Zn-ribbon domain-containing OB-fold protein [Deltaproteobacteria bacterium]|nr:Zn-ribbon domain-containing OB-fold protein [Deltaproteobacteria bacterium]